MCYQVTAKSNVNGTNPEPGPEGKPKSKWRTFTVGYKLSILAEADRCTDPGEVGALLRREGLHSSNLTAWRRQRDAGELAAGAPKKRGRKPDKQAKRLAQLERENERLRTQLEQADMMDEDTTCIRQSTSLENTVGGSTTNTDETTVSVEVSGTTKTSPATEMSAKLGLSNPQSESIRKTLEEEMAKSVEIAVESVAEIEGPKADEGEAYIVVYERWVRNRKTPLSIEIGEKTVVFDESVYYSKSNLHPKPYLILSKER